MHSDVEHTVRNIVSLCMSMRDIRLTENEECELRVEMGLWFSVILVFSSFFFLFLMSMLFLVKCK